MTPQINGMLAEIRRHMEKQESWGPEGGVKPDDDSHTSGEAGDGGAENVSDAQDALDKYLADIADQLTTEFEVSDDDAWDFIGQVASECEDEGELPPMPDYESPDADATLWLGKATSILFAGRVLKTARDQS